MNKPALDLVLAAPRGFCAGVDRAIHIVELALAKFGPPIYVRHEIVHNRFVVESLEKRGVVFVDDLNAVPAKAPVVFSAHGVAKSVPAEAEARKLFYLDATCPLVSKVHREAERHFADGRAIVLIGHEGHPEVIGTMGQLPPGAVMLVETIADAEKLKVDAPERLAFITQTTLSVDDTADIVAVLRRRFPAIQGPRREDICYATSNRQAAVKAIAPGCDAVQVNEAHNQPNPLRLVEVPNKSGNAYPELDQRAADIDWAALGQPRRVGITAGASAPEELVEEVVAAFRERFEVSIDEIAVTVENVHFKLPRALEPSTGAA